jgi:hypothetical protein
MDDILDAFPPSAGGDRYTHVVVLGEGGMGQVQQVDDAVLGRAVARKVMHAEISSNPTGVGRFLREARIQGRLEHPAAVAVYDLGLDEKGLPWFTMKHVRSLTLQAVLDGGQRRSANRRRSVHDDLCLRPPRRQTARPDAHRFASSTCLRRGSIPCATRLGRTMVRKEACMTQQQITHRCGLFDPTTATKPIPSEPVKDWSQRGARGCFVLSRRWS